MSRGVTAVLFKYAESIQDLYTCTAVSCPANLLRLANAYYYLLHSAHITTWLRPMHVLSDEPVKCTGLAWLSCCVTLCKTLDSVIAVKREVHEAICASN